MNYPVELAKDDCNELERLHYMVEARAHLIQRLITGATNPKEADLVIDRYLSEYDKCFKEYDKVKSRLEAKYKPSEYAETAKSWTVDFNTGVMTFEVADA